MHHLRVGDDGIDQRFVPAGMSVAEAIVVEAELVEDRGVQVRDADPVVDCLVADLVGRSVHVATLESATAQPQ